MTEEQATKLVEMVKEYNEINLYTNILVAILIVVFCVWSTLLVLKMLKEKRHYKEWKATLTDEQLKAVNKAQELMK